MKLKNKSTKFCCLLLILFLCVPPATLASDSFDFKKLFEQLQGKKTEDAAKKEKKDGDEKDSKQQTTNQTQITANQDATTIENLFKDATYENFSVHHDKVEYDKEYFGQQQ